MPVLRRHFGSWCDSYQPGRSPVNDRLPWITFEARLQLSRILRPGSRVVEYGAGGSILYFLDQGCSVTTVEHDSAWLERIRACVRPDVPWTSHHVSAEEARPGGQGYLSAFGDFRGLSFERYVHALDYLPPGSCDILMVDGRARGACLIAAIHLVAPGGFVILDNSERPRYATAVRAIERAGWRASHFHGPGPYVISEFWNTSVFQWGGTDDDTAPPRR